MGVIAEPERTELYTKIRHILGAPLRSIELEDEQMDTLLEFSIGDYSQYVQDWLIQSQWANLYNLNLETQSVADAFVSRDFDYTNRYMQAYSKIVGLQTNGDSVLLKDFITLVPGQQIYEIPAGREVNELLWFTPAAQNNILFDPWSFGALGGYGLGGPAGYSQMGYTGSYFMMPGFDMLLRMQEINIQRRMIAGDLTYRMTALPEGKKAIHLMQTPGGKFDFGNSELKNMQVWYWYYEVEVGNPDQQNACYNANPEIIKLPSDVPLAPLRWEDLNNPARQFVRRWFIASCKETLAKVRGKYSGNLKTPDSELTMDYQSLATEGKDEKAKLEENLKLRLDALNPKGFSETNAAITESLNKELKLRAFPRGLYVI
jgi:hypothetical protein